MTSDRVNARWTGQDCVAWLGQWETTLVAALEQNKIINDMNTKDLMRMGVPSGEATHQGMEFISQYITKGLDKRSLVGEVEAIVTNPEAYTEDKLRADFARALIQSRQTIREVSATWRQWGEGLESEAINQMSRACGTGPVSVAGALMPDAHVGYGLPIGGVLATDNAVIPYAVGVDIACRMKLTVLDLPLSALEQQRDKLVTAKH